MICIRKNCYITPKVCTFFIGGHHKNVFLLRAPKKVIISCWTYTILFYYIQKKLRDKKRRKWNKTCCKNQSEIKSQSESNIKWNKTWTLNDWGANKFLSQFAGSGRPSNSARSSYEESGKVNSSLVVRHLVNPCWLVHDEVLRLEYQKKKKWSKKTYFL